MPRGRPVLRIEGRWETPLSSWKEIQAFCWRAFFWRRPGFLKPAIHFCGLHSRACVAGFVRSIASPSESSRHDRDDSGCPSIARSTSRLGVGSINRFENRLPAPLLGAPRRVAPIVRAGDEVSVPPDRLPPAPRPRLVSNRRTSDLHFAGLRSVLERSPPGIVCPSRSTAPLVCVVVLIPENHVVAELSCS